MDRVFVQSISSEIQTTFILEDLRRSSIKVFLRNVLKNVNDDALRDLDWKKQVGAYLVKAKYAAISWLDEQSDENAPRKISDLTSEVTKLAKQTDTRRLPDYPEPNKTHLAQAMDHFQEEKAKFKDSDKVTITLDEREYSVVLENTWSPSEHLSEEEEERELSNEADMFLIIRKPDFLGNTQWQFKHGRNSLSLPVEDGQWLEKFKAGEFPIKPGDALRVRVRSRFIYDKMGDLRETEMTIIKVFEVKPMHEKTKDFWAD